MFTDIAWSAILPEVILIVTALVVIVFDLIKPNGKAGLFAGLSLAGLVLSLIAAVIARPSSELTMHGMVYRDTAAIIFKSLIASLTIVSVLLSVDFIRERKRLFAEFYALILFSAAGMMIMVAAAHLIAMFLALEIFSIALYILAGFYHQERRSSEAALKYFLLGAFASAFFIYGVAMIYGSSQTMNLEQLGGSNFGLSNFIIILGTGLLIVGLGFKVAIVPFHSWVPDVYEGSPTPVTAFMSVGAKAAGFAVLLRVLAVTFTQISTFWTTSLWILAVITMCLGNLIALNQDNVKRMLAYSTIAHTGYMLIAVIAADTVGWASVVFYVVVYTFMNLGAFGVVILLERQNADYVKIDKCAGLGIKYPLLGTAMTIFMMSLAGIPPFAGFVGKFYIFNAAIKEGYIWLAVIGVLNSVVALYYYIRVPKVMFIDKVEGRSTALNFTLTEKIALVITGIATLVLGIYPTPLMDLIKTTIESMI